MSIETTSNEKFTEPLIRELALELINNLDNTDDLLVTVTAEWDRKQERMSGPINSRNSYRRSNSSDYIVTVQLRIPDYSPEPALLLAAVNSVLTNREEASNAALVAEKQAKINVLEAELEALRNS
jgi:hypothetical protein